MQQGNEYPIITGLAPEVREWLEETVGGHTVEEATISLRLYVAGEAPNSALALSNLRAIFKAHPDERIHLEVIDILKDPMRAITDNVIVTPALIRMAPLPAKKVVGNLSDTVRVVAALGLGESSL